MLTTTVPSLYELLKGLEQTGRWTPLIMIYQQHRNNVNIVSKNLNNKL